MTPIKFEIGKLVKRKRTQTYVLCADIKFIKESEGIRIYMYDFNNNHTETFGYGAILRGVKLPTKELLTKEFNSNTWCCADFNVVYEDLNDQ